MIASRGWLLKGRSETALKVAQGYHAVADETQWKARWRFTELIEARDLWLAMLGRRKHLVKAVRRDGLPPVMDRLVLLGMHWGPSVLALELFRDAGLAPRFVYRRVPAEVVWIAPFYFLYLKLLVAYIRRACDGRDIPVPGARSELVSALDEPGTPVILLDAPITSEGRSMRQRVLHREAEFYRDGLELLATHRARCVLYTLGLDDEGVNTLRCGEVFEPASAEDLLENYAEMMSQCLARDSAQWRLWHAAGQLFRGPADAAPASGGIAGSHKDALPVATRTPPAA